MHAAQDSNDIDPATQHLGRYAARISNRADQFFHTDVNASQRDECGNTMYVHFDGWAL
jgi:hypothetical protein